MAASYVFFPASRLQNLTSDFILVRHGRDVIRTGRSLDHLEHLPGEETTCPVRKIFFRYSGVRVVRHPSIVSDWEIDFR